MSQHLRTVGTVFALVSSIALSACAEPKVIRVYNGDPVTGRFIDYEAYASYGRGIEAERDRNFRVAARWFEEAAQYDPNSVEVWTHLVSTYCSVSGMTKAQAAFAEGQRIDPTYEPLYRAQARCALANSRFEEGAKYAARAIELDPDQDDAIVVYAVCAKELQKYDDATRVVDSHLLRHPNSVATWQVRLELAQAQHDAGAAKKAAEALLRLAPRMADELTAAEPTLAPLARVDDAIRQGNIDEARKAARRAHLPPGELAVRAVALGAPKLAREQAEHVLGADPASAAARVALASASDVLADEPKVALALEIPANERLTPLSPLARLVYADLLARHADRSAARAFVGSLATDKTDDPVYEALRLHLVGRLGGTNSPLPGGS